jgi:ubiquinone biosynthesis protein
MIKAMATTEGVGIVLDSEFDMVAKAAPFIERIMLGRMHPRRVIGEFFDSGMDLLQLVKLIPGETSEILRQIKEGRVRIGFEHRGLEDFAFHMDRSSNRIAFALIISSLIIGSSLIIRSNIGPYLLGFPILGLLGFSIAGIFGIGLLISILRLGRL